MSKFAILFRRDRAILTMFVGGVAAAFVVGTISQFLPTNFAHAAVGEGTATITDVNEDALLGVTAERAVSDTFTIILTVGGVTGIEDAAANPTFTVPAGFTAPDAAPVANAGLVVENGDWSAVGSGGACAVTMASSSAAAPIITVDVTTTCAPNDLITLTYKGVSSTTMGATAFTVSTADIAANGAAAAIGASPTITVTDTTAPTVVLASVTADPTNGLIAVTAEFSETVTLFVVGDVNLRNGAAQDFVAVDGNSYTFNVNPDAGGAVAVTIDVPVTTSIDAAGNANAASNQLAYTSDDVAPTVAISDDQAGTAADADATVVYTFEFSETVTGFTDADVTVNAGGAKGAFTVVDGNTYTSLVTATDGSVANIDITADNAGVIDAAGNALAAPANDATQTVDTANPTVVLASVTANPTNGLIAVTAEFSEDVTLFVVGDVTVGNGAAQDFVPFDGNSYTFNVNPDAGGAVAVTIDVLATTSVDAAGNANAASNQLAYTSDDVAPTVVIASVTADPTNGLIAVTAEFSEAVTGFLVGDVAVVNGAAQDFVAVDGDSYTFNVNPDAGGAVAVTIDVPVTTSVDAAGNANAASNQLAYTSDDVAPTVVITDDEAGEVANIAGGSITYTFTFSEVVTGFLVDEVVVDNGTKAADFATGEDGDDVYTLVITPEADLEVDLTVIVGAEAAADFAGNLSEAADGTIQAIDTLAPTFVSSTPENDEEGVDRDDDVVIEFSEAISEEEFELDGQFTFEEESGDWTEAFSEDGTTVTLTHEDRLSCGEDYVLTLISAEIFDLAGNPVDGDDEEIAFSTQNCSSGGGSSSSSSSATSTAAVVTLTGPDSGDDLDGGDVETVTWTTSGSGNDTIELSYSTNAGVSYTQIAYDIDEDDGSYDWTVPNVSENDVILKITSYDSGKGSLDTDTVTIDISSTEDVADEEQADDESIGSTEGTTEDSEGRNIAPGSGTMGASPLDGSQEEISVVVAGQFVRAYGYPSVYYVNADMTRSVFWDTNTFFTWADSWDNVVWVSNATLSTMTLGGAILPKPGVTLVKIQSDPKVYAIDEDGSGDSVLRWVPSEEVAIALYGSAWADYVIDIDSTVFSRFGAGSDMSSSSVVDRSIMKTRVAMAALAAGM